MEQPTRPEINLAIHEYLQSGRQITMIHSQPDDILDVILSLGKKPVDNSDVDDFLSDQSLPSINF